MVVAAFAALIAVACGRERVALLMVAVPVVAPRVRDVAAPPILRVVAPLLKRVALVEVVVRAPPLSAKLPAEEILPVVPVTEKLVPEILPVANVIALTIAGSERSRALVMAPPPDEVILIPAARVLEALALSTRINWLGVVALAPAARENLLKPVEPLAVVTLKLESVAVSAKVKAISLLFVVEIVLPPV